MAKTIYFCKVNRDIVYYQILIIFYINYFLIQNILGTPDENQWPEVLQLPDYGKLIFPPSVRKI